MTAFDDTSFGAEGENFGASGYDDGYGDEGVSSATAQRQSWPTLRQFCIFLENRVGKLQQLLRHVERHDLRVVALSIVDTVDFAVPRIMLDDADRAREIFELGGFTFFENDVVGVVLPDDPQPYLRICLALLSAEMNIHYTYPLNFRWNGRGVIALQVDDVEAATRVLEGQNFQIVSESDLRDDPFG